MGSARGDSRVGVGDDMDNNKCSLDVPAYEAGMLKKRLRYGSLVKYM